MKPAFFATPAAFRRWLDKNHDQTSELLVGFYKKEGHEREERRDAGARRLATLIDDSAKGRRLAAYTLKPTKRE